MRGFIGALFALIVITGLGTSDVFAQTPPASTTTPTATPPVVSDADVFRDDLLALALGNLDAQAASNFIGLFPAWKTKYPGLGGSGSGSASTPGRVSIFYNLLSPKESAGPGNPSVIAFAVSDTQGRCAGAVIYGFPKTDKNQKFAITGPCTAENLVASFRTFLAATPVPSATVPASATVTATAAPQPPAVGNSLTAGGGSLPWGWATLLVIGTLLATSAGMTMRRAKRS